MRRLIAASGPIYLDPLHVCHGTVMQCRWQVLQLTIAGRMRCPAGWSHSFHDLPHADCPARPPNLCTVYDPPQKLINR